jgi:hypothetical protein
MGGNPRAVAAGIAIKRPPIMNASLVVTANHAGYVLMKTRVGGIRAWWTCFPASSFRGFADY